MAQTAYVMAFRKRLKKCGYQAIRISYIKAGRYLVEAIEPLGGVGVQVEMVEEDMYEWRCGCRKKR